MPFQIDDRVVHAQYGVGRIVRFVTKHFAGADAQSYYEIALTQGTAWVLRDTSAAGQMRPLTAKSELAHCRDILRSCPVPLTKDHRQRKQELVDRLRSGSFQGACEVVRDVSGAAWHRHLGEADAAVLRRAQKEVCQEWAAAAEVSVAQAAEEVDALLQEARLAYRA